MKRNRDNAQRERPGQTLAAGPIKPMKVSGPYAHGRATSTCQRCDKYLGPVLWDYCNECQEIVDRFTVAAGRRESAEMRAIVDAQFTAERKSHKPRATRIRCRSSERRLSTIPGANHYSAICPDCDRVFLLPYIELPVHYQILTPSKGN